MNQKTKVIEIDGTRYQVARFRLDLASYLLGRILRAIRINGSEGEAPPEKKSDQKPDPEDIARAMIAAGLFGDIDRATRTEIQNESMKVCSRLEGNPELPMPLSNGTSLLIDDLGLVLRLEMEALVFNLAPFFGSGGLNALAGPDPNSLKT